MLQVKNLIGMEIQVLEVLDHRVKLPTAHTFWAIFGDIIVMSPAAAALAMYLVVSVPFLYILLRFPCLVTYPLFQLRHASHTSC